MTKEIKAAWIPSTIITSIIGCARCHGDGHALTFTEFHHPVKNPYTGETIATYWAMCPVEKAPILMHFVSPHQPDLQT